MKEIIKQLTEFRENIDCDVAAEWTTLEQKLKFTTQSTQIMLAIAMLNCVGENNNIPE